MKIAGTKAMVCYYIIITSQCVQLLIQKAHVHMLLVRWIQHYFFYFQGKYIAECIDEIKQELRQENQAVKANAVNKLLYVRKCKPNQKNVNW